MPSRLKIGAFKGRLGKTRGVKHWSPPIYSEFTTQQMIDALSPANFFATNPEALETILQTQGQSLQKGIVNLLGDL
ncbi:MAG: hypothetical protein RIR08_1056, partial [Pseudomonadota bacterium]